MHFTFGLLSSRKIILISHCSGGQQDLNPVFNDKISCAYTLDATLVIEYSLCGGTISPRFTPESFLATLTSDSWLLLTQRNKYISLSIRLFGWSEILIPLRTMFLGVQKFGILFHVWEIRNSEACPVYFGGSEFLNPLLCSCRGSEIFSPLLCSLRDQKVWIVSRSSWGTSRDKKFRKSFGFLCVAKTLD